MTSRFPLFRFLFLGLILVLLPALSGQLRSSACITQEPLPSMPVSSASSLSLSHDDPVHLLLIGKDSREGQVGARSDAIILCSFQKDSDRVTMTSVLRDLYVPIPGCRDNRINAAYALGGASLLCKTLESILDLKIDGWIEMDFSQFSGIINTLGGVSIQLRRDEADLINRKTGGCLSEGLQHLTGEEALTYARIRSLDPDGDLSRTARQRKLVSAVLSSWKSADLSSTLSLIGDSMDMISTDMSKTSLMRHALELFPLLSHGKILTWRIPEDGDFQYKTIAGMSVVAADLDEIRQRFYEQLSSDA